MNKITATQAKGKNSAGLLGPISIGAVLFSSYVGPGFASGTQTVSYFLTKGWMGIFLGPILVGILAFIINLLQLEINRVYKPKHYREAYNFIYRSKFLRATITNVKEMTSVLQAMISVAAQISAASILFHELWNMPFLVGTLIFCTAVVLLAVRGASLLRTVGTALTLCILGVCAYIGIRGIGSAWPATMNFIQSRTPASNFGFTNLAAWYIMLTFISNFLCGADAAIPASLGIINKRKDVLVAALTNFVLCVVSTLIFTIVFAAGMPEISNEQIPTLWAIRNLIGGTRGAQMLYAIMAISAMLSTGVSFIFAISERFEKPLGTLLKSTTPMLRKVLIAVLFILICAGLSTFGILNIVKYGFTALFAITVPICLWPLLVAVPYRLWKDKKTGQLPETE